ncbi:DinB family protein [uncultured Lacinutrix sp.]|uniref:DinB family protein n=1 Tax=uncultured Lacinutrix sp. TaxID=574032 RepID=UPI002630F15F|nr:DinB family protein [uncultured Lacinutrix sp.]
MTIKDLSTTEYLPYFQNYINQVGNIELIEGLENGLHEIKTFYQSIPKDKLEYRYAEGKWTIKEVIVHLLDTERIFCYRALRFSRKDKTPVSGFEQDDYVANSESNARSIEDLIEEFVVLRQSTICMFKSFARKTLLNKGIAGSGEVSVRALGFLIIGHEKHHCRIIEERYL